MLCQGIRERQFVADVVGRFGKPNSVCLLSKTIGFLNCSKHF
jgi:hypothetical protein